jgi:hypothetical protein
MEKEANQIDLEVGEISGLVDALKFIAEEEGDDAGRMRRARVSILYVMGDKLDRISGVVGRLRFWQPGRPE